MQILTADCEFGAEDVIDLQHLLAEVEHAAVGEVQPLGVGDGVGVVRDRKFAEDVREVLLGDRADGGNLVAGGGAGAAGIKGYAYRMRKRAGPLGSRRHLSRSRSVVGDCATELF